MKNLIIIIFLVALNQNVFADEPPCWCEFSITSSNNFFRADIEFEKADSLFQPWERKWTIKIFETKFDTILIWESEFNQDGYGAGTLSNDGQVYVYVNYWLNMDKPPNQVTIYTQKKTLRFSGKDLSLKPDNYPHTVSHQIWIDEFELTPNYLSDSTLLLIQTKDFKEISISIKSAIVENAIQLPKFTEENIKLKNFGIGVLIFIGLGIILIVAKKQKKRA